MTTNTNIQLRDIAWIKTNLQSAIELEFSTLPLYLSAMFSLEIQNYSAYNLIRSVAMEEMVHMAIACNMLAALGGTPNIKNIQVKYPTQGLPGGAEPDLNIGLAQLSKNQILNFMRIECPLYLLDKNDLGEEYPTISVFYNQIKQAIIDNADEVRELIKKGGTSNQVGDDIGFTTFAYQEGLDPVKMLCAGIDEILEQGEGKEKGDLITSSEYEYEESHYAKFAALYYGKDYKTPEENIPLTKENEPKFFTGNPIGWPEVVNTLYVPSDGYEKLLTIDPNGTTMKTAIEQFDTTFAEMLTNLDLVWNGSQSVSWPSFGKAVHGMVDFRVLSCFNIMRTQIADEVVKQIPQLYPDEIETIKKYTDLTKPLFYGPRFINTNQ
ncbi:MAG: ferritin-like protein [Limnohabitans sp.]|nr:ferritin-like protein [Limnohabitans sp.]